MFYSERTFVVFFINKWVSYIITIQKFQGVCFSELQNAPFRFQVVNRIQILLYNY